MSAVFSAGGLGDGGDRVRMPMFPLGSVLFPELGLPLRVFEPRYRQMVAECLEGDQCFGVVLIERGSEVGGGETRLQVATVAQILDVSLQEDGTLGILAVGVRRVEVVEWLPDAPYPVAMVASFEDDEVRPGKSRRPGSSDRGRHPSRGGDLDPSDAGGSQPEEAISAIVRRLRFSLAQRAEANLPAAPSTIELSPDLGVALWQVCALTPATPIDDYRLLVTRSVPERLAVLGELFDAAAEEIRFHLS